MKATKSFAAALLFIVLFVSCKNENKSKTPVDTQEIESFLKSHPDFNAFWR